MESSFILDHFVEPHSICWIFWLWLYRSYLSYSGRAFSRDFHNFTQTFFSGYIIQQNDIARRFTIQRNRWKIEKKAKKKTFQTIIFLIILLLYPNHIIMITLFTFYYLLLLLLQQLFRTLCLKNLLYCVFVPINIFQKIHTNVYYMDNVLENYYIF